MQEDIAAFFKSEEVQRHARAICEIASVCWEKNLSDASGFSISQVIPGTKYVLVDKSGTAFRKNRITPNDLLLIDLEGSLVYLPGEENPRRAPVNSIIHLMGYTKSDAKGCVHWHDPYTNAFACYGKTIHPLTLQSKLMGDVPCVIVDDREEKTRAKMEGVEPIVPSGFHARPDVYVVMRKVGKSVGDILSKRNKEFVRHGIAVTHYEHGLFAFGRDVEEAFENGYRVVRNAQTIIYSGLLKEYPDERARKNAGKGDTEVVFG